MKDKPFIYRDNNAIHDKIMREANALKQSGFKDYTGAAVHTPALENTALYRAEYDRQQELHKQAKEERKKQAKENRREQKSAKKRAKKAAAAGGSK